jgi:RNA polymerase sigma factor (TIGR02999 family)
MTAATDDATLELERHLPEALRARVTELMPILYDDLRRMARGQRFKLSGGQTFTTTALVNETYLRLLNHPGFGSQQEFLRIAAVAMHRILVDRVREQLAEKRGGGAAHLPLDDQAETLIVEEDEMVLAVHDALGRLSKESPRLAQIAECRFFGGYDERATADALGVSERTVRRDWTLAKAWLARELGTH